MDIDFKSTFEQLPALMVIVDTSFTLVAATDSYLNAIKTTKDTIVGQKFYNVFPWNPTDKDAGGKTMLRASITRVIQTKVTETLEVVKHDIPHTSGDGFIVKYWRPIHFPVLDKFNNVEYVIQQIEDITDYEFLKCHYADQERILKEVSDSEKRYSMLLMKSPFAFGILKGEEMVITLANESIIKIWGKSGKIVGRKLFELLPELIDTPFPGLLANVYRTGIPFYGDEVLAQIRRGDLLDESYYNFIYQPYLEADETISGVTIIAYDVTTQVTLKKTLAGQRMAEKKVSELIEENNKRFFRLLMKSPFAFSVIKGKELVVTLANDLMKEFWGKGDPVEGRTLLDILPELQGQPFSAIITEVLLNGIPVYAKEILAQFNYDSKSKDRYFNVNYQPYFEVDNTISGVIIMAYEVTEMVLARKKIEESECRFQAAVQAVDGILWTNNAKGEMEGTQLGWAVLTGQSYEEYQKYGWSNVIHPDDIEATMISWNEAVETKKRMSFEHRLKLRDGNWGLFSIRVIPLFNSDGFVREWVGVHTDITRQRHAENAVIESEKRFKRLVDSMPQKISNADRDGNLTFFNQQWLDETGLSFEELRGSGWEKSICPEDLEKTKEIWKKSIRSGNVFDAEYRIINNIGEYKWNLSRAVPLKDEGGKITMWVGSHTDIHEQKEQKTVLEKAVKQRTKELEDANYILVSQNEVIVKRSIDLSVLSVNLVNQQEKLSNVNSLLVNEEKKVKIINEQLSVLNHDLEERVIIRTKALAESENKFRNMMETLPHIAWTNTMAMEVNFFNQRWYEYTGFVKNLSQIAVWESSIHEDDLSDTLFQFNAILKAISGGGFQARIKSQTGEFRWHLIRLMPIKDEQGHTQLWVGTATDIHELRLIQQQKDDFISIASHELKTPITSLKINLEMLSSMKDRLTESMITKLLTNANRSIDKYIGLINDLLNASKANEGQLHLNKTLFSLSRLVDNSCHFIQMQGLYKIIIKGDTEIEVFADEARIEQVIINFVNNCIKYASNSKKIIILISKINDFVKLSVIDEGPGIPAEKLEHLFGRYYRVDSKGSQYSGLGLGLYIASEIIKKHHGQIGVQSKVEKGSIFWFTLPLYS